MGALRKPEFITVEQFLDMRLPESHQWELVDGVVYSVTFPVLLHVHIQNQLARALQRIFGRAAFVEVEFPYSTDEFNTARADIAAVGPQADFKAKTYPGAPTLVIEVISISNRAKGINRLQQRCLSNGCVSFWRVYPKKQLVAVAAMNEAGGVVETLYGIDDEIPVALFGKKGAIPVRKIFQSPA